MTDEERMAVIKAENAEIECEACHWLGREDETYTKTPGSSGYIHACPACKTSTHLADYESALYRAEQALP